MSECGRTPTNPNGYGGMDFTPPVTHPDYRDARIAELERQLAEARKGTRDDIAIEAVNTHPLRFKNPNVAAFDAYRLADSMMIARIDDAAMAKEDSQ